MFESLISCYNINLILLYIHMYFFDKQLRKEKKETAERTRRDLLQKVKEESVKDMQRVQGNILFENTVIRKDMKNIFIRPRKFKNMVLRSHFVRRLFVCRSSLTFH